MVKRSSVEELKVFLVLSFLSASVETFSFCGLSLIENINTMSSAFVRESDEQNLIEVAPTLHALLVYLRRQNGGMTVREIESYYSEKHGRDVYEMSDGLTYAKNDESKWYIILD